MKGPLAKDKFSNQLDINEGLKTIGWRFFVGTEVSRENEIFEKKFHWRERIERIWLEKSKNEDAEVFK